MQKEPIGKMKCPECGHPDALVKEDKNGMAYRWCPDCYAQYFTRDAERDKRLRALMAPLKTEPATPAPALTAEPSKEGPGAPAAAAPKPAPAAPATKKKPAFSLGDL